MITRYKVGALEVAAVEQEYMTEIALDASNVYFAPTAGFISDNVQAAIVEASHYSDRQLITGDFKCIPFEQQMLTYQALSIDDGATLEILGEVIILT